MRGNKIFDYLIDNQLITGFLLEGVVWRDIC